MTAYLNERTSLVNQSNSSTVLQPVQQPVFQSTPLQFNSEVAAQWLAAKNCGAIDDIKKAFNNTEDELYTIKSDTLAGFLKDIDRARLEESSGCGFGQFFKLVQKIANIAYYVFLLATICVFPVCILSIGKQFVITSIVTLGLTVCSASCGVLSLYSSIISGAIGDKILNDNIRSKLIKTNLNQMTMIENSAKQFPHTQKLLNVFHETVINTAAHGDKESTPLEDVMEMGKLISEYQIKLDIQKKRYQTVLNHLHG